MCPAGYVLEQHTDQNLLVCECNNNVTNIVLCADDQEIVIIQVCVQVYIKTKHKEVICCIYIL